MPMDRHQNRLSDDVEFPAESELRALFRRTSETPTRDVARLGDAHARTNDAGSRRGSSTGRRVPSAVRVTSLVAAGLLVAAIGAAVWTPQAPSLMAQAVTELREVSSYRCTITWIMPGQQPEISRTGKLFWAKPDSIRLQISSDGKLVWEEISPAGKPGLQIDHENLKFSQLPANRGK